MDNFHNDLSILDFVLKKGTRFEPRSFNSLDQFWDFFNAGSENWEDPFDLAVYGGLISDRVAYAFVSGYESAIRRLFPDTPRRSIASFCVTEKGGTHPKNISCRLDKKESDGSGGNEWTINGAKRFITCARESELYYVLVSCGTDDSGKNILKFVRINRDLPGISMTLMSGLPFVPEVSHGEIAFTDVAIDQSQILPYDGYAAYAKPFRTVEDIYVLSALFAYLFGMSSAYCWPKGTMQKILKILFCLKKLAAHDPLDKVAHIVLGSLLDDVQEFLDEISPLWGTVPEESRNLWERDRPLFSVAEAARRRRLDIAWASYEENGG